jgi:hypothetical protein
MNHEVKVQATRLYGRDLPVDGRLLRTYTSVAYPFVLGSLRASDKGVVWRPYDGYQRVARILRVQIEAVAIPKSDVQEVRSSRSPFESLFVVQTSTTRFMFLVRRPRRLRRALEHFGFAVRG